MICYSSRYNNWNSNIINFPKGTVWPDQSDMTNILHMYIITPWVLHFHSFCSMISCSRDMSYFTDISRLRISQWFGPMIKLQSVIYFFLIFWQLKKYNGRWVKVTDHSLYIRPLIFKIQGHQNSEMHRMTPNWTWTLNSQNGYNGRF